MSRSGYSEDIDNWALIRWRGQVASATKGARGQALMRDLLAALDAMPVKRLIADEHCDYMTPEARWVYMRQWTAERITSPGGNNS